MKQPNKPQQPANPIKQQPSNPQKQPQRQPQNPQQEKKWHGCS